MTEEEPSLTTSSECLQRATVLKDKFCEFGECDPPSPSNGPEWMRALLAVAGSWHIIKDHCGVFGLNMFENGGFLDKVTIIGDAELVEEWRDDHESPNCGEDDWECFGATDEFTYLFVCMNEQSEYYGQTRRIVNNCWEDDPLTESCDEFFQWLEDYVENWLLETRVENESKED